MNKIDKKRMTALIIMMIAMLAAFIIAAASSVILFACELPLWGKILCIAVQLGFSLLLLAFNIVLITTNVKNKKNNKSTDLNK